MLAVIFVTFLYYPLFKSNKLWMPPDLIWQPVKQRHDFLFLSPLLLPVLVYHQFADYVTHLVLIWRPLVFYMLAVHLEQAVILALV